MRECHGFDRVCQPYLPPPSLLSYLPTHVLGPDPTTISCPLLRPVLSPVRTLGAWSWSLPYTPVLVCRVGELPYTPVLVCRVGESPLHPGPSVPGRGTSGQESSGHWDPKDTLGTSDLSGEVSPT